MSAAIGSNKRYFQNDMQDHLIGTIVTVDHNKLKQKVFEYINKITRNQPSNVVDADGGLYVGIAGVAYMFYKISLVDLFADRRSELLQRGTEYIEAAVKYVQESHSRHRRDPAQTSAFLLGGAGILAVAAALYSALGDTNKAQKYLRAYSDCASNCKKLNFLPCGGDELFVGRAGYLYGVLWLQKLFKCELLPKEVIYDMCNTIVQSGREYSRRNKSPCPLMYSYYDVEYLGAAHGISAILQVLLSVPEYVKSYPDIERDVKASVDYLLSLQNQSGNFPCALDEIGHRARKDQDQLVHWCHGAPGIIYLMAKAYLVWQEEKYLKSCLDCGELVWKTGLLKKGPGICHGVTGNGYVFLLLFRLTGDHKHLHRAQAFADFLDSDQFVHHSRVPDSPYSLHEGISGTCCFLTDLTQPMESSFPLFDVYV